MNEIPARAAASRRGPRLCRAWTGRCWPSAAASCCASAAALVDIDAVSALVGALFARSTKVFGLYWQILMLATFVISLGIGFSRCGRVRLGGVDRRPDISTFNWIAVIMCALLAGGGAFWAAAEPLMHFASPPPLFAQVQPKTEMAAHVALAQSFVHWGFRPGPCLAACWPSC